MRYLLIPVLLSLALTGHAGEADVKISEAWVRAVPPVAGSTAAYFLLVNQGQGAVTLQGARADFAAHAMFHQMGGAGNDSGMQHLGAVTLPPGESVRFAPGGRHLMLTGLKRVPTEGESVQICLVLSTGDLCHAFPVRRNPGK